MPAFIDMRIGHENSPKACSTILSFQDHAFCRTHRPELSYTGRVACIGEAMVELMLGSADSEDARFAFAGDTLNTAIYLKRLLPSAARVSYISVLGQDPLSRRMVDFIRSEGIDTQHIGRSKDRSIGLYAIETDDSGERTFSYWRGQSAARTLFQQADELDFSALANFDSLCLSAITLAILPAHVRHALLAELARLRAETNVTVIFDSNYRPALWESVEIAREVVAAAWRITDMPCLPLTMSKRCSQTPINRQHCPDCRATASIMAH